MRSLSLVAVALAVLAKAAAQSAPIPVRAGDSLLVDALGQVYVWDRGEGLTKHRVANDLAGADTLRYRYANVRLGPLHSVDVTNPLRPLLFYGEAQVLVYLHRNLTELRQVNLVDLGLGGVDAVAFGQAGGFWAYSADRQRLFRVDAEGQVRDEGPELSQLFGKPVRARELVATPHQVALATDDGRVLLFGPFGAYRTQLLLPGRYLQADDDRLLLYDGAAWLAYAGRGLPLEPLAAPREGARLLGLRGGHALYVLDGAAWVDAVAR